MIDIFKIRIFFVFYLLDLFYLGKKRFLFLFKEMKLVLLVLIVKFDYRKFFVDIEEKGLGI